MKSKEILKKIQAKREEARGLLNANDMAGARKINEEIRSLEEDLETALEIEEGEMRDLQKRGARIPVDNGEKRNIDKQVELRALGKYILGMNLNEEERGLVTVADNDALLPEGYVNELMLLRDGYPALKKFCHVIPVKNKTGKMPVAQLGKNKLAKLSSDTPIDQGAVSTSHVKYDVEDYGKFVPIENSLTDDEVVGIIESILMPDFAEGSVEIENEEILNLIKADATPVEGEDYTALEKAIDTLVPAVRVGAITITNTAGFSYLKNKKDAIGRKLDLITYVNGQAMFNNKPIIELSDSVVEATPGKLIFYVVNLKEAVKFFDRAGIVITKSKEFLFNKNQDCLRAIERFDAQKGSMRSCKKVEFSPTQELQAFSAVNPLEAKVINTAKEVTSEEIEEVEVEEKTEVKEKSKGKNK